MTEKEKNFLKKVATDVLSEIMGFAPSRKNIRLLESGGSNTKVDYLLFEVAGCEGLNYRITLNSIGEYQLEIIQILDGYDFGDEMKVRKFIKGYYRD